MKEITSFKCYSSCCSNTFSSALAQVLALPYPEILWGCRLFDKCSEEKNCCAAEESGGIKL